MKVDILFEPKIDSSGYMDPTNEYSKFVFEMMDWCRTNIKSDWLCLGNLDGNIISFEIEDENLALLFKLRF